MNTTLQTINHTG